MRRSLSLVITDSVAKRRLRLDPEWLRAFIDPSEVYDRIRALPDELPLSGDQDVARRQFVAEYESWLRAKNGRSDLDSVQ
jgi:hypothetical protein